MSSDQLIPVVNITSGDKFVNEQGIKAIKNGIKASSKVYLTTPLKKPEWLRIKSQYSTKYKTVKSLVRKHHLSTVCEEAMCPNINECWSAGTATIMLMGSVCTRACKFCAVDTGNPKGWLDEAEPDSVAETTKVMGLKYVVLTSVDRDDLKDGGAAHYAAVIKRLKQVNPQTAVEALTPDFSGNFDAVKVVIDSGIEVFAQNIETVERLTSTVRDPRAGYHTTLKVLEYAKKSKPTLLTKTSLMLGLGEKDDEIEKTMDDLRQHNVDILTLGQYLQPTQNHLPVKRYVSPDEFNRYREIGLKKGFLEVVSGVFVRSSYRAERVLEKNNAGL